jgi:hypothetical protein
VHAAQPTGKSAKTMTRRRRNDSREEKTYF